MKGPDLSLTKIEMSAQPGVVSFFYYIFQRGFIFPCNVETSIEDLLLRQMVLDRAFVEEKVSTVFLDGRCVDDIASAILKNGSVVALSSAMPGLAGATMRRKGIYSCLRESIAYADKEEKDAIKEGLITIKLFNLLMTDLGRRFLEKGIILPASDIMALFSPDNDGFWMHVDSVKLRGRPVSREEFTGNALPGHNMPAFYLCRILT